MSEHYIRADDEERGITVVQLRNFLNRLIEVGYAYNCVVVDTEAAKFDVHYVDVRAASLTEDFGSGDLVTLHLDYKCMIH